jgi:hypothetical protein
MRSTTLGLSKGSRIRVVGMGRRGTGSISRDPVGDRLYMRSDWNAGEYYVELARVRLIRRPRFAP